MALILSGDAGITFPVTAGSASAVQASSGRVLQVVQGTYGTIVSSTTATYIDTGLTATITPSSSTSKILVLVSQNGVSKTAVSAADVGLILLRGATTITGISLTWGYGLASRIDDNTLSTCYLDSPATTSATTYKTQFKNSDAAGTVYLQYNGANAVSTITLMEISA